MPETPLRWLVTQPLQWLLPALNLAGCLGFLLFRAAIPAPYLAEIDAGRGNGGIVINSAVSGIIACRDIRPWDEWHGGEALGVKILQVANAPATAVVVALDSIVGGTLRLPVCQWSWVLAGVFVTVASVQWWLIGTVADSARRRWHSGRNREHVRPSS